MNNTIKNKRKHMTTSKHKTKTNEPVWHWIQYADIMFEFILLPVVMLLALANINRILLLLVIPASILLGVHEPPRPYGLGFHALAEMIASA